MTKEQEDIKYLKENVCVYKNAIPKISEAIETVLNMLKENSRENIQLKKQIDLMAEDWFFKEGYKLQIYIQRNRTDDRIFRKKRIYNKSI